MPAKEYERLARLSETGDVPMAVLVRRALALVIGQWEVAVAENRMALL